MSGWVHAGAYEHGCWHQLCSSIHFYFIFLHLGVSLNQMNRIESPEILLSLIPQSWDCRYTIARDCLHGCWDLNLGFQACAASSLLADVISLGTDIHFLVLLIIQEILLIISQMSPICSNFYIMIPLEGGRSPPAMSETCVTVCFF